jgi:hypothetical protein
MTDPTDPMPVQLSVFAELRKLLIGMEEDLGLKNLNRVERDLFHACQDISDETGTFVSSELRAHKLLVNVPPATFHRALKRLLETGMIKRADNSIVKNYVLARR